MRLTIAYSKIKKRNLVLINNVTHQRETLTERPIRLPLKCLNGYQYRTLFTCTSDKRGNGKPSELLLNESPCNVLNVTITLQVCGAIYVWMQLCVCILCHTILHIACVHLPRLVIGHSDMEMYTCVNNCFEYTLKHILCMAKKKKKKKNGP